MKENNFLKRGWLDEVKRLLKYKIWPMMNKTISQINFHKEMYHMDERLFMNEIGHKKCLVIV
jgi:hypothetical protein